MQFEKGDPKDEIQVKQVLETCELPHEDIKASHLHDFWILRDDNEIAGVVGIEPLVRFALLRSLAVLPRHRYKGIATRLTIKAEEYARSQKAEVLYLLTTTAEGFFKKNGYRNADRASVPPLVRETTEFQAVCPESAVCMYKNLDCMRWL